MILEDVRHLAGPYLKREKTEKGRNETSVISSNILTLHKTFYLPSQQQGSIKGVTLES